MATTPRRLPLRVWCGAFPLFALPPSAVANDGDAVSVTFFGSDGFARLRTQLRLKLQETPPPTQSRRLSNSAAHYTELLALVDQYARHVVALLRYVSTSGLTASGGGDPYEPLFFGFAETDLRCERLVGHERRLAYALPVDVVLTLVLRGQLHALHAETLVDHGLTLQSEPATAAAELSWRKSMRAFAEADSVATATLRSASWCTSDPQLSTLVKFFTSLSTQCSVLARVAQMHRAATRLACLILLDETTERLARNAAVCARYAYAVAAEACGIAAVLDDSSFSRQLAWLVQSYAIRWRAIFYGYEQTVFQLDFHPEIALHFGELVHRAAKLPPLPPHHHRHRSDAVLTRLAHELQQSHTAQLAQLLDTKVMLLALCKRKCGPQWTLQSLPRDLYDEMEKIPSFDALFEDEDGSLDLYESDEGSGSLTAEAIARHVERARERASAETMSLSAFSTRAVEDEAMGATARTATSIHSFTHDAISTGDESRPPSRPSSAGSTQNRIRLAHGNSTRNHDWVTLRVGDKVLHFEPLPSPAPSTTLARPPRPLTAGTVVERRRHAISMVLADDDNDATTTASSSPLKPRPSSSPSYLRSASKRPHPESTHKALTWVPTRAPCALCERRFTRANLPGVVVMKRVFDLRRKWGMVLSHDAKKFSAASALYGRASVCVLCHDILTFEDDQETLQQTPPPLDDVGVLIRNRIQQIYLQLPPSSGELLLDVAVGKRARQSSTNFGLAAQYAVRLGAVRTAHTKEEFQPWWEVDLGNYYVVHSVKVWLREDPYHDHHHHHAVVLGGASSTPLSQHHHRKMGIDASSNLMGVCLPTGTQPNVGLYPLYICVSMKTGVGRDFDDVLASAVSFHCAQDKAVQPITWLTPPNCRGRFVRLQSTATAFLHIEKVHVYVAQPLPTHAARRKRELARSTLQRAAFRASVISKKLPPETNAVPAYATAAVEHKGFVSAFTDPEQAEKRRLSRLYLKFKGLLDARSKYHAEEERREDDD